MADNRIDRTEHYDLAIFDPSQIGVYFDDFVKYLAGTNNSNMKVIDTTFYNLTQQIAGVHGDNAYVHIRWGTSETPEELLTEPAEFIGICTNHQPEAPTNYEAYKWYKYKGEAGVEIGEPPEVDPLKRVWIYPEGTSAINEIIDELIEEAESARDESKEYAESIYLWQQAPNLETMNNAIILHPPVLATI
ncbi:MAG: hypothetical protein PHV07_04245 [Oscillospiraceae bacterium]|nr:hypothetical protein [Oscillospiraceae bacterium]